MTVLTETSDIPALRESLSRHEREVMSWPGFRQAAVLVPLLRAEDGLRLLLTVRSTGLSNHAGQISFPGGRLDDGETVEEAAIRETAEEIGIAVHPEMLVGRLDDHPSPARYIVTPVLALIDWPQRMVLEPAEVAEVFTVPLNDLWNIVPRSEERQLEGQRRSLHFYDWRERIIWGLTGNVLKNVLELLDQFPQQRQETSG